MEFTLFNWLRSKGLEHYFVSFVQSELIDLVDIGHLNLPDEQLYDELEMTLPGHKRRFERAGINSLLYLCYCSFNDCITLNASPNFIFNSVL